MKWLGLSMVIGIVIGSGVHFWQLHYPEARSTFQDHITELRFGYDNFSLGQYYFNHGDQADGRYDIQKARHYYELAAAEDPQQHILLWHQLGRIDFLEGKFQSAIEKFKRQIELYGDTLPNVHYMLALTYGYQARDIGGPHLWEKAEEHFLLYLNYDPLSPWARVDLAWVYFAQGKYQEMIGLLETGLTHQPDNPWLLNMYGLALLNTGDSKKAQRYFIWADQEASKLTVEDWGKSYPGNDPTIWGRGLEEFRSIIRENSNLTEINHSQSE